MGSKEKFYSIVSASNGFDDVGLAQPSGTISGVAQAKNFTGRSDWQNKVILTINSNAAIKVGQPINITAIDSVYNGLTKVLAKLGTTRIIINKDYSTTPVDVTGIWDTLGGASVWGAMMPIGADLTAANIAMTFWDPSRQGGNEVAVNYTKDKIYVFPAEIKTILIATAGNVRLFRSASTRPWGKPAQ